MNSNKTQKIVKDDLCLQEKGFHKKFREIESVFLIFTSNFKKNCESTILVPCTLEKPRKL